MSKQLEIQRISRRALPTAVLGIDLSDDGEQLYAACMDGVYRLDVASGEFELLAKHRSYASGAMLLEPESLLVTAGYDGQLLWHDLNQRKIVRRVQAHRFWSWRSALSPDRRLVASVTGQYQAGDYRYRPAAEVERCVRVFDAKGGQLASEFSHVPSVQSVAFSPDSRFLAAGNLMGEIRVWDLQQGDLAARWTTPDFTSWGVIKSHCYIGGIFALQFLPDSNHLLAAGMGPMRDPMAGNGRQLWQRFCWTETPVRKVDQTHEGDSGEGLMETLALPRSGGHFFMGGRLRGGSWNGGFFELPSGALRQHVKTGFRITSAAYQADGRRLFLAGADGQPRTRKPEPFGKLDVYQVGE